MVISMKSGSSGACIFGANVTVNFVAPWVAHSCYFVDFAAIFAFTYRRVVVRELANLAGFDQIEPGIADLADCDLALFQNDYRQNASHASPGFIRLGEAKNLIICNSYRFTNTLGGCSGGALQAGAQQMWAVSAAFSPAACPPTPSITKKMPRSGSA